MDLQTILNEFKQEVANLYGSRLKQVVLYGSYARGEADDENSDIDLAIVLGGKVAPGQEIDKMIDIVTEINLKYNVLISIYPVSEEDYKSINSPLLLNLRKEGVVLKSRLSQKLQRIKNKQCKSVLICVEKLKTNLVYRRFAF